MQPQNLARSRGFSVVELMVSVVIGMLALVFATRLLTGAEGNKQAAIGASDSMQNGVLAMFSISGDAAQAGFGLNDPIIAGCDTTFNDTQKYALATASRTGANPAGVATTTVRPLAAALIGSNGNESDILTMYSGSSMGGTGTLQVAASYSAGTKIQTDRVPYSFAAGDVIVVAPEKAGDKCALAQLSATPADKFVEFASAGRRFNNGTLGGATFTGGAARVFNLGPATSLAFHTWSVADGFLQLRATDLDGSAETPATVADNIVSIKAQYGLDTRAGAAFQPELGLEVKRWSAAMVDADGDGVTGGAGDYQRIAALRIAVVARSKNPERAAPGAACTATVSKPVVFALAGPIGEAAEPVTVNVGVANDPVDWTCYRYRVIETIVPLRNAGWRPTA